MKNEAMMIAIHKSTLGPHQLRTTEVNYIADGVAYTTYPF